MKKLFALALAAALLAATAPPWPDGWDGIGFLESVRDFDLARFQPHPPGYPVYVALLRTAAVFAGTPMRAAIAVAVVSGVVSVACTWLVARRLGGERAAWAAATLAVASPAAWHACNSVGSEGPALAFACIAAWGVAASNDPSPRARSAGLFALGVAVGFGLGVRLSWAPIYAALLLLARKGGRLRATGAAAGACALWGVPFVAVVGPAHLARLYAEHASGHAERWGGTAVTEPGNVRLLWLARDIFVDGLGAGADPLGIAIAVALTVAGAFALLRWHRAHFRGAVAAFLLCVPYLVWIGLGQNLREQPRHALPIAFILAGALALISSTSRRAHALVSVLGLLVATRTAVDSYARRTIAPPGQELVDLAASQPSPERLDIFGMRSVRFFEPSALAANAFASGLLGDVQVRLARLPALPTRVWVTSEVAGAGSRTDMTRVATLCRPPRLARDLPCIEVYSWRLPYLPPR